MFTWTQLKHFDMKCVTINIPRSIEIQKKYESYKISQYCKIKLNEIKEHVKKNKYLLKENGYPYDISPEIYHYVFF
jgi:hypothetical protein